MAELQIKKGKKQKNKKKIRLLLLAAVLLLALAFFYGNAQKKKAEKTAAGSVEEKNIALVTRGAVSNELSSSGSLSPKDTYSVTSLVEGEITEAPFEEGDQVEKGQVLFRIDASGMDRELDSARKELDYAEADLSEAEAEHRKAEEELNGGVFCAKEAGYIRNLTVKAGDSVSAGSELSDLYNDATMKLRVPFLSAEADAIAEGTQMIVTLSDTGEQLPGQVLEKSALEETINNGVVVKYVTLIVSNPGGLTETDRASAQSGALHSAADGSFEAYTASKLRCDLSQPVKVASVLVHEGQYVTPGTPVFTMTEDSYADALKQKADAVEQAEKSLEAANDKLEQQQEKLEDYVITAPISGQVIKKGAKAGEKISKGSNSSADSTLAIIYDLSELTFEMSIDELDISDVEAGQQVAVTADAFEGEAYSGRVSNVSLNGSYTNGVTTYPVTVTLSESGALLPGMNVDGTILLDMAEDVLRIPVNALQRGNIVYVKDTSLTEEQKEETSGTGEAAKEEGKDGAGAGTEGGMAVRGNAPEGFTAVKVETGLISEDYVEIVSGLSEGQEIYVRDSVSSGRGMFMMRAAGPGGMGPR